MIKFTYDEIIEKRLPRIPEIKKAYDDEARRWTTDKMGPYNLFDIIVMPHLINLLKSDGHEEELRRAFNFFEVLMHHPDKDVRDVVGVAVCEDLCSHGDAFQRACRFMGTMTKHSCDEYLK